MKKLMIVAAAAAMTGIASAAVCVENECTEDAGYTAYKMALTLKTTVAKEGTYGKASACDDTCSCRYYFTQKTMKLAGVIYGEAECEGCTMLGDDLTMLLWNTTTKESYAGSDLSIYLGRYEKDGAKAEAWGTIAGDFGQIVIAGFGKMYVSKTQADACSEAECYDFVKTLSGNAAGFLVREESDCDIYTFSCCEDQVISDTKAASGTWKIVYDATLAKKLAKGYAIETAGKVPSYVDAEEDAGTVTIEE